MVAGVAHIIEEPPLDKAFLFLSQPFYLLGKIGNGKVQESRCNSSDEALCVNGWSHEGR